MAPEFTEVLFSLLVSYVGAMEFVFIARSFYHWINQHHKFLDGAAADETLEQMQERMKAAIDVAKSQEFGDYKAMVDGVLYKDGFRVDPDTVAKESERQVDQVNREVIGSSRDSAEEERQEVQEEPCVKKIVTPNKGQRISKERSPMPNETPSDANLAVAPQPTPEVSAKQTSEPLPEAIPQSIRFDEYERQAPDGEDHVPAEQFSEDYLRSLDGIKNRRLVRDDGTGRRRSFKKRRSSDDSISSIDSRKSREEEVQMFTSLEEEEFENMKRGDSDYVPIRYSSDTSLKVGKPSKRHSKSPMKDVTRRGGSNEPVEEEAEYDPWGEVKPEHYKDTQFWKREKNISIEEERDEDDVVASMKLANNDDELGASSVEPTTSRRQMPKESSFEQATSAQNQEAIESLQKIGSKNSESKRSDENSQTKNVSNQSKHDSLESFMAAERKASIDPTNQSLIENACDESTPTTIGTNDQRDDLNIIAYFIKAEREDQYETEAVSETLLEKNEQPSENLGDDSGLYQAGGYYETTTSTMETDRSPVSNKSDYFDDWNKKAETSADQSSPAANLTPDITKPVPTIQIAQSSFDKDEEIIEPEEPSLQGLSDFYDFNASINPTRSGSRSRSRSRSKTPVGLPPLPPSRRSASRSRSPSPVPKPPKLNFDDIEGVSDFLDFCVKIHRESYDPLNVFLYRNISQTSDDFLLEQIRMKEPKGATKKNFDLKLAINKPTVPRPGSPSLLSPVSTPVSTPMTPPSSSSSRRRSSVFEREIEFIRQHQRLALEQDGYDNYDYDEVSEDDYRFRRSRSQSRSVSDISDMEGEEVAAGSGGLQDKILAEIARTTINYQDFSKDLNAAFNDNEQIVEDSMMTAQPEIVIQIDSNRRRYSCDDEDYLNRLEGEEYHHYRRYSLRQDYIEEEYPEDNEELLHLQRIRHGNRSRSLSPPKIDYAESSPDVPEDKSLTSTESEVDYVEDADETGGSDDERQTVVGADDDIGGDVWNGARVTENENYIHSDDEIQGEIKYENGNLNEGDWKEHQGAVGGAETVVSCNSETSLQIEEIYNEVVEDLEPSQIETDYDNIFNEVKAEVVSQNAETELAKADDIIEEILNEPDDASLRFLDHERLTVANRKSPFGRRRSPFSKNSKFLDKERSPSLQRKSPSMEKNGSTTTGLAVERSPSADRKSPNHFAIVENEQSVASATRTTPELTTSYDGRNPSVERKSPQSTDYLENYPSATRTALGEADSIEHDRSPSADRTSSRGSGFFKEERSPSATRTASEQASSLENNCRTSAERTSPNQYVLLENERSSSSRSPSATRITLEPATFLEHDRGSSADRTSPIQSNFLTDDRRSSSAKRTMQRQSSFLENYRSSSVDRKSPSQIALLEDKRSLVRSPSAGRTSPEATASLENDRSPSVERKSPHATDFLENEQSTSPRGALAGQTEWSPTRRTFSGQAFSIETERSASSRRTFLDRSAYVETERSPSKISQSTFLDNERSESSNRSFSTKATSLDNERSPSTSRASLNPATFLDSERSASSNRTLLDTERSPSATRSSYGHGSYLDNERSPSTSIASLNQANFLDSERSASLNRTLLDTERSPSATRSLYGLGTYLDNERSPSANRTSLTQSNYPDNEHSHASPSGTTRTRLRTRYGITSTTPYTSYDYNESTITTNEITYEPKKEYNWRKNFKLDDEDDSKTSEAETSNIPLVVAELAEVDEENDKEVEDTVRTDPYSLDDRKFSLGGESITLYSQTPDRLSDFLPDVGQSRKLDDVEENDAFDQDEALMNVPKAEAVNGAAADVRKEKKKKRGRKASLESSDSLPEVYSLSSKKREVKEFSEEISAARKKSNSKTKRRKSTSAAGDENHEVAAGSPKRKSPKRSSPESALKTAPKAQITEIVDSNPRPVISEAVSHQQSSSPATIVDSQPHPVADSNSITDKSRIDPPVESPSFSQASASSSSTAANEPSTTSSTNTTRNRPPLERKESSGAYELIKDGSMYPWF